MGKRANRIANKNYDIFLTSPFFSKISLLFFSLFFFNHFLSFSFIFFPLKIAKSNLLVESQLDLDSKLGRIGSDPGSDQVNRLGWIPCWIRLELGSVPLIARFT